MVDMDYISLFSFILIKVLFLGEKNKLFSYKVHVSIPPPPST